MLSKRENKYAQNMKYALLTFFRCTFSMAK